MSTGLIITITIGYLALLFGIAYWVERSSKAGQKWMNGPVIYALSMGVYCTAWTFFGSVGRAATAGLSFLPIYLGPTILAPVWILLLRKIILISKSQHLTSVADFISSRYGKSTWLGTLATLIAVFGIIPYISIQLKAITIGLDLLILPRGEPRDHSQTPFFLDTALYITGVLAVFAILFGTRHLDPNERHEGLITAIAFESVIKLVAFLAVGIFVTFSLFDGFGDLFTQAMARPDIARLFALEEVGIDSWQWFWLNVLSMFAFLLLPRQFHVAVVENENPAHLKTASWMLPAYLLLINLFVLPIAVAGLLLLSGQGLEPDTFVLTLPLAGENSALAYFAALGGFSAATSMVIVATIALSIMISNNLVLPFALNAEIASGMEQDSTLPVRLLGIRRISIVIVLLLAYGYFKSVGANYSLVSIGLISFTAVAQFAPTVLAGIYWKRATKAGAFAGLTIGFLIWAFTLPLPTLVEAGFLSGNLVEEGLFGFSWLRPYALFGMEGSDQVSHAAFWSLSFNTLALVIVSLYSRPSALEISQADLFVDIYKYRHGGGDYEVMRRRARVRDIQLLLRRFLGPGRADFLLRRFEQRFQFDLSKERMAGPELVNYAETHLAGAIGTASAKVIISSVAKEDPISLEEMFKILEQTQEIMQYSRALERKSAELEQTTLQLRAANDRLHELDRLKADFITTVTHELRTPITSIKALARILQDNRQLPEDRQEEFLGIIVSESERIGRLINQVLDLEKIQRQEDSQAMSPINFREIVADVVHKLAQLMEEHQLAYEQVLPSQPVPVLGNPDRLTQVVVNLLSNAIKFCPPKDGLIQVRLMTLQGQARLTITDNGPGIPPAQQRIIFDQFTQVSDSQRGKPEGSGLGLYITQQIVRQHQGEITLESQSGQGASFTIILPLITG
ncbi:MAG: hypothetical protein KDC54_07310 [Lewinella sp.]|nr:hypothetical protein [Lewinella sp.]